MAASLARLVLVGSSTRRGGLGLGLRHRVAQRAGCTEVVHDRYDGEVRFVLAFDAYGLVRITDVRHRGLPVGDVGLPVKLRRDRATELRVTTRPYGDLYIASRDRELVAVRPAR